jgi:hypothetical protein
MSIPRESGSRDKQHRGCSCRNPPAAQIRSGFLSLSAAAKHGDPPRSLMTERLERQGSQEEGYEEAGTYLTVGGILGRSWRRRRGRRGVEEAEAAAPPLGRRIPTSGNGQMAVVLAPDEGCAGREARRRRPCAGEQARVEHHCC